MLAYLHSFICTPLSICLYSLICTLSRLLLLTPQSALLHLYSPSCTPSSVLLLFLNLHSFICTPLFALPYLHSSFILPICTPSSVPFQLPHQSALLYLYSSTCTPLSVPLHLHSSTCTPLSALLYLHSLICAPSSVLLCSHALICTPSSVFLYLHFLICTPLLSHSVICTPSCVCSSTCTHLSALLHLYCFGFCYPSALCYTCTYFARQCYQIKVTKILSSAAVVNMHLEVKLNHVQHACIEWAIHTHTHNTRPPKLQLMFAATLNHPCCDKHTSMGDSSAHTHACCNF